MADTADGWLVQASFKTRAGTLINVRAMTVAELDVQIEAMGEIAPTILATEALFIPQGVAALSAVGGHPAAPPSTAGGGAPTNAPNCQCGNPAKYVKGGISKAGKPYSAFWACNSPRESQCNFRQTA